MVTAVHVYNLYIFIYLLEGKGPCPNIYIFLGHTFLSLEVPALDLHFTNEDTHSSRGTQHLGGQTKKLDKPGTYS